MPLGVAQKIISEHLCSGELKPGEEISIRIDQTLTQDATGTMAFLEFEAMKVPRVRTKLSVSYVDHNTLQTGPESANDHRFLQTAAAKYGVYFSRPGNGICHQVHLERFAVPGETLLGSDSHTPTCGGIGMLAIGAGGIDVAAAMAGMPFHLTMPQIVRVVLTGKLGQWVSAKDIILELLRRLDVKGGVGKLFEFAGDGLKNLTVPERATITNMGTELGATSSVFPSDNQTKRFLAGQGRARAWREIKADADASYDDEITIRLEKLEPLIALPHSPGNVKKVSAVAGTKVQQVCIGSCTNSSYQDLMLAARMLKGKRVHPEVSMTVSPGSRQVYQMLAREGAIEIFIKAGVRILESACGPCVGMGQAPPSGAVSLRTFNRNFKGRSGTPDAKVYLCSPAVAVASAITGEITDPRKLGRQPRIAMPKKFLIDDSAILEPPKDSRRVRVVRGPNIKPVPIPKPPENVVSGKVLLKVGDNITTDDILPAGAKILPLRSNIPAISEFVFVRTHPDFVSRAKDEGGGFIVGGWNYGQGSSREHAAIAPMFLGVRAVIAKSFARIHRANLVNFGIIPVTLERDEDFDLIEQGDVLEISGVKAALDSEKPIKVKNTTNGREIAAKLDLTSRERRILSAGGLLNLVRRR